MDPRASHNSFTQSRAWPGLGDALPGKGVQRWERKVVPAPRQRAGPAGGHAGCILVAVSVGSHRRGQCPDTALCHR